MDAIIGRPAIGTAGRSLELATVDWLKAMADWLKATRRLARAALAVSFDALVNTSRAGLLVRGGVRRRRRL